VHDTDSISYKGGEVTCWRSLGQG